MGNKRYGIYDEIEISIKQRIFNFLCGIGFIKSPNWIFGK